MTDLPALRRTLRLLLLVGWFWLGIGLGLLAGTAWLGHGQAQSLEVAYALDHAAATYNVSRGCLFSIAYRESRYLPWVDNYQGSGAAGLMQFLPGTYRWMAARAGYPTDPGQRYNAWNAAHVAAWAISRGYVSHWGGC